MSLETMSLERTTLVGGRVIYAHAVSQCKGGVCCIHNPTEHHMKDWTQIWRDDRGIMERICSCGIGHPDPDDLSIRLNKDGGTHGCCGCCSNSSKRGD